MKRVKIILSTTFNSKELIYLSGAMKLKKALKSLHEEYSEENHLLRQPIQMLKMLVSLFTC